MATEDVGEDVVALLPGFLGFARIGGFRYYADRVSATLRGALEERFGRPVPVLPLTTLPTGTLAERQRRLVRLLAGVDEAFQGRVRRIHLVGHSLGGVDARFLAAERPLHGAGWDDVPRAGVLAKIASTTTIASPLHGSSLATAAVACILRARPPTPDEIPPTMRTLAHLAGSIGRTRRFLTEAAAGAALAPADTWKFVRQMWQHRGLVEECEPARMEPRLAACPIRPGVRLRSFVTMVLLDEERADPFFHDLYDATAEVRPADVNGAVTRAAARLREALQDREAVIHADARAVDALAAQLEGAPADVAARLNDGMVNSTRQLADPANGELAGIVIADHADALGHYDRIDPFVARAEGAEPINAGLFHSGSHFGDDQFFALYHRVAAEIAAAVEAPRA